jgi:hypothetical protein
MKSRLWICLLMGLLALSILPAAAQDDADHDFDWAALNCLGLSEADCAIVTASTDNLETIESFSMEFSFSQSSGNTEGMVALPGLGGSVDVQGTMSVAIDHSAMSEDDPSAGVSMALTVTSTKTDGDGTTTNTSNVVIADGNIYIQNAETGEWIGTDVEELSKNGEMASMSGGMSFMGMPMGADQMMGMGMGAMNGEAMAEIMGDFDLEALLALPGFLNQSRLADETVDGQTMNAYAYTADLGVLLQEPSVQNAVTEMMAGNMGGDSPMGAQMASMMPVLLQNTTGTATLTRWVGADDQLPHRVAVDVQVAIDLFGGASGDNTPVPPITISLTLDASLRDINSTPTPTAPEGATMQSAEEFLAEGEATPEATP